MINEVYWWVIRVSHSSDRVKNEVKGIFLLKKTTRKDVTNKKDEKGNKKRKGKDTKEDETTIIFQQVNKRNFDDENYKIFVVIPPYLPNLATTYCTTVFQNLKKLFGKKDSRRIRKNITNTDVYFCGPFEILQLSRVKKVKE